MKGRLEDMEAAYSSTVSRVTVLENQNTNLQTEVEIKQTVVAQNQKETEDLTSKVSQLTEENCSLKKRMEASEDNFKDQIRSKERQIQDLEYSKATSDRRVKSLGTKLREIKIVQMGLNRGNSS